MSENKMDNRGSKPVAESDLDNNTGKEQRVHGSQYANSLFSYLRCILTGFERNHQVRIPSNQINNRIRLYSLENILNTEQKPDQLNLS